MRKVIFLLAWLLLASTYQAEATCDPNIPGDINGDCKVDFNDFAKMASDWLKIETLEPNVVQEWADEYNGPGNGDDCAYAIAIDSNDNIYVTGESFVPDTNNDFCTIKYASDNNIPLWVARYNGPSNGSDYPQAIAIDSNDNVYVTGYGWIGGRCDDYLTIKYSPESNEPVWVARYNGPANIDDSAKAIAIDSNDNIYVTGHSIGSGGTTRDAVTIKYDTDGNEVWVATYSSGDDYYYVNAMAIDGGDNIYVTGKLQQGQSSDYFTIKYSGDSNEPVWMVRYNGLGDGDDTAWAITTDSNNNIYVTGRSKGTVSGDDYATIKYDTNGNEIWVARYNGPGDSRDDAALAIAVDSNDNIYVAGASCASDGPWDYATIKYTPDSNIPVWVARYNGPENKEDLARAIVVDSNDNIYVTGESIGSGTYYDYATVKYDSNGSEIWVARYSGPGTSRSNAEAIAIDSNDNVYVTGYSEGTAKDYATVKYSSDYSCTAQLDGDLNDDSKVDFFDLAILASNWLECNLEPPSACWE